MAMAMMPTTRSRNNTKRPRSECAPTPDVLEPRGELELVALELDVPLTRVLTNAPTPLATAEEVRGLGVSCFSEARTALWREDPDGPL